MGYRRLKELKTFKNSKEHRNGIGNVTVGNDKRKTAKKL